MYAKRSRDATSMLSLEELISPRPERDSSPYSIITPRNPSAELSSRQVKKLVGKRCLSLITGGMTVRFDEQTQFKVWKPAW